MGHFLVAVATLGAGVAVALSGVRRLALAVMLLGAGMVYVAGLLAPDLWTFEVTALTECGVAFLAVLYGLGAARRARAGRGVMLAALGLVAAVVVGAVVAQVSLPLERAYAYRGLAFADALAVAVLAAIAGKRILTDRIDNAAVPWLVVPFALSAVYFLLHETPEVATRRAVDAAQQVAWVWAMLCISRAALGAQPRLSPTSHVAHQRTQP